MKIMLNLINRYNLLSYNTQVLILFLCTLILMQFCYLEFSIGECSNEEENIYSSEYLEHGAKGFLGVEIKEGFCPPESTITKQLERIRTTITDTGDRLCTLEELQDVMLKADSKIPTIDTSLERLTKELNKATEDIKNLSESVKTLNNQHDVIINALANSTNTREASTIISQHIINNQNTDTTSHFYSDVKYGVGGNNSSININETNRGETNTNTDCCGCFRSQGDMSTSLLNSTAEEQNNTCCEASFGRCNIF